MSCSSPRPTRFVSSVSLLCALLVARPVPGWAQQADEATIGILANVLGAADARRFDAAALREALSHPSPVVRRQGALAAGRSGDPAAIDLLLPALNDSAAVVRSAAAFALGLLKDARALPALVQTIRAAAAAEAGAPPVEAITAIAKIGGDDGAKALADILAAGSPAAASPVVNTALLESWRLGTRAPIAQLVRFTDATDAATRWRALYSLARLRAKEGAAPLIRALSDPDHETRTVGARGLSKALLDSARVDQRDALAGLRRLLDDRDAHIRINALRALASFRDSGLAPAVVPLVADRDIGVAVQAETTLGVLRGSVAVAALGPRLTSSIFALKRQALIALAQADSGAGIAAAAGVSGDADWRWRSVAADLLARHPGVDDVDLLVAAYRRAEGDPFNDARLSAVSALGAIAAASSAGRVRVASRFVASTPRPEDYLVRRLAADTLPDTRDAWGPVLPIATGRTIADYREIARRWLAPALAGTNPHVILETDRGRLDIELLPAEAPVTVAAFLGLVERRFFDGMRWHRVVPNFVVQDGDPRGDGWGGPGAGFVLRDEINPVRYDVGTVGMALSGPNTGGSQYFITHSAQPHLDGIYTIFGRVVSGADVLNAIGMGDRIRSMHR